MFENQVSESSIRAYMWTLMVVIKHSRLYNEMHMWIGWLQAGIRVMYELGYYRGYKSCRIRLLRSGIGTVALRVSPFSINLGYESWINTIKMQKAKSIFTGIFPFRTNKYVIVFQIRRNKTKSMPCTTYCNKKTFGISLATSTTEYQTKP